ncbi:MAG TPA: cytochrome c-type biogenesis protein [Steroidobacteraceae bacterium]|jgi:cytochrome c-type biogenesis protein CcmH|nr:cytochrome c-type biogenesis protein [Steroidobacteraceae bacterium]
MVALQGCLTLWLLLAPTAHAVDNLPPLSDPVLRQRYDHLTHELRCMQCQNESLADSQVSLAADLREQVRELLLAGRSDDEILNHMSDRYGDFILFRPRMNWRNSWLWGAPLILMSIGAIVAWRVVRDRARHVDDGTDADAESLNS